MRYHFRPKSNRACRTGPEMLLNLRSNLALKCGRSQDRASPNRLRSFTFSDLDRATFRKGVYLELSLEGSSARFVQFDGSDLSRADFTGTALQQTSFVETKLSHAAFNWANVNGADFKDAYDMGTVSGFIARDAFNVPEMFEPRLTKPKIGRAQFQSPYYFGVSIC
eukprot:6173838-Pleurochrysis_carterae.AAC.1